MAPPFDSLHRSTQALLFITANKFAGDEGIEPPIKVLETFVIPLN